MGNRTELKHEFLGTSADNSHISGVSGPRAVMHTSHFAAHLPLLNPDERLIKSGIEYEMGKYINDVRAENDCIVKAIIPRYKEYGVEPPSTSVFVEFEKDYDDGKGLQTVIDIIDVPAFKSNSSVFGYNLTPTEILTNASYGQPIRRDDLLAKADSYGKEGSYNAGLNANVVFMSHPSVSEDGFVVSESFCQRAKSLMITKRVININKNTIPLNSYGDDTNHQFMPNIGQMLTPSGLLCALRDRNDFFSVYDLNNNNLRELDVFDTPTYVPIDSTVIDIQVIRGNSKPEFSTFMTRQLDEYAQMLINFYSRITATYEQIMEEKRRMYGSIDNVRLSPSTHRFITDCYVKLQASLNRKNTIVHRKLPIDQYRVEITCRSVITPDKGFKLADFHGHKGLICAILPDHEMPVDSNGVRAEVISDSATTISRMNPGRAYESYLGGVSRDNKAALIHELSKFFGSAALKHITIDIANYAKVYLKGLYAQINTDLITFIDSLNEEELIAHTRKVIEESLSLYFPPDNERNVIDVIRDNSLSKYRPHIGKVSYVNADGVTVQTKDDIQIGVLYFLVLEKIANLFSAVSSSKVNNFGLPVKGSNVDKHRYPHSQTPNKFLDESSNRILISHIGSAVADMIDLAQNPVAHKALYKEMLQSPHVYNTQYDINRQEIEYGQTKPLQIINHMFTATGFVMEYVEPEKL